MSDSSTWLHGKRKSDLVELADKVGLKDYSNLKKGELEAVLDGFMQKHSTTLARDPSLSSYYKRMASSPVKRESEPMLADAKALVEKAPKVIRKVVKSASDATEIVAFNAAAITKHPRSSLALAAFNVPLPPSPAVVATHIERQTAVARQTLSKAYRQSGIGNFSSNLRDRVSDSPVEYMLIFLEILALRAELLPSTTWVVVAGAHTLGTGDWTIHLPDLFKLLRADFWSVFLLWLSTSVLLPYAASYYFNLTLKTKHAARHPRSHSAADSDPMTFNITKALLTWLVYDRALSLYGYPSVHSAAIIRSKVPGGVPGMLIGTGIGVLTSLYEAVLKK